MVLEKTIAGTSEAHPFSNVVPSSECTPYWLFPGAPSSHLWGETAFGELAVAKTAALQEDRSAAQQIPITLTKLAGDSDSELFSARRQLSPTPALPGSGPTHALPRRVEAEPASAVGHDLQQAAGHRDVLEEVDELVSWSARLAAEGQRGGYA
ncbi:hypothetical protein ACU4GD_11585 [Cupriavidus basilensis]